jgi:hypothetical protein
VQDVCAAFDRLHILWYLWLARLECCQTADISDWALRRHTCILQPGCFTALLLLWHALQQCAAASPVHMQQTPPSCCLY